MQKKLILFDLDGTLTDPGEGITNSVAYALKKYGISVTDRTELYPFIGPPLMDSFQEFYGFSREQAAQAVVYYREYFTDRGIFENELYDGVPEMLDRLRGAGYTLAIATSKPDFFAEEILRHFAIDRYFSAVAGADREETRVTKADVVAYALALTGLPAEQAVMVGDRKYDVIGAGQFGIPTVGAAYGYGSDGELSEAGAFALAHTPAQVAEIFLV